MTEPGASDERERAIAALFTEHRTPMIRLATLLGADDPEDIVAEAFYQLFRRWRRLRDRDAAVSYLRSVVCNLTRMRLRHLRVARRYLTQQADPTTNGPPPDHGLRDDQRVLLDALTRLPIRQREALVLRYWLDLRGSEIADAMGISPGAVKSHTSRGMAALTRVLDDQEPEPTATRGHHALRPRMTPRQPATSATTLNQRGERKDGNDYSQPV
jgi:RNA polymerase sigma-70 factor (sigma-E family)